MKQFFMLCAMALCLASCTPTTAQSWTPSAKVPQSKAVPKDSVRCNGTTQKKAQCKLMVDKTKNKPDAKGHYYCHFHASQAE